MRDSIEALLYSSPIYSAKRFFTRPLDGVLPGLDALVMIGSAILTLVYIITALNFMTKTIEGEIVRLITDMPNFAFQIVDGVEVGNASFLIYSMLRDLAYYFFLFVFILVGVLIMFKQANLVSGDTIKKMLLGAAGGIIFLLIFPYLWDPLSQSVESFSLSLLNPQYSGDDAAPCVVSTDHRSLLFAEQNAKIGERSTFYGLGLSSDDLCRPDLRISYMFAKVRYGADIGTAFENSSGLDTITNFASQLSESVVTTMFTGLTKTVMLFYMSMMTALIHNVRFLLVDVIAIAFPLLLVFRALPFFYIDKISNILLSMWVPLVLVPIFTALIILAGTSHLLDREALVTDGVDRFDFWMHSMSVMMLAVMMPVIVAPILGSLSNQMGQMVMSGVMSGVMGTAGMASAVSSKVGGGFASRFGAGKSAIGPSSMNGAMAVGGTAGGFIGGLKSAFGKAGIAASAKDVTSGMSTGISNVMRADVTQAGGAAPGVRTGPIDLEEFSRGMGITAVNGGIRPGLVRIGDVGAVGSGVASSMVVTGGGGSLPFDGSTRQGVPLFGSAGAPAVIPHVDVLPRGHVDSSVNTGDGLLTRTTDGGVANEVGEHKNSKLKDTDKP